MNCRNQGREGGRDCELQVKGFILHIDGFERFFRFSNHHKEWETRNHSRKLQKVHARRKIHGYKQEWNNAICSNMDGPRDYHTKWSKSDRKRQIASDITGKSQGQRSLAGYSLWSCKELDTTEQLTHTYTHICGILKNYTNELIYQTEIDWQT